MSSRRDFIQAIGAVSVLSSSAVSSLPAKSLRVRTITAGVNLRDASDLGPIEAAIAAVTRGKQAFVDAGYEVQTLRIATNPFLSGLDARARERSLDALQALDRVAAQHNLVLSVGPALVANTADTAFPQWAAEFVRTTRTLSFSAVIASSNGAHAQTAAVAARAMIAIASALPDGIGNFRFAAAANIPPGTPFFPVAWHLGPESLAIGLESASVVEEALSGAEDAAAGTTRLRQHMNAALAPVERIAQQLAVRERRTYLGIDSSPAPGKDRSIAAAIEALTHQPFGSNSTLEACAAITAALKSLDVKTCGYSGLMLPVLEDPLLAQRAGEKRYGIRELLLYSSVCGTGLDVVPIPGDSQEGPIAGLLRDVAALSGKLTKPLSARLFIVPGKHAGEMARFTDPVLTDSVVMDLA
jgi:uncharacterized protein (UPF0210 family)